MAERDANLGCDTGSLQTMVLSKYSFISGGGFIVWPQGYGLRQKEEHELQKAGQGRGKGPRQGKKRPGPRVLLALMPQATLGSGEGNHYFNYK